MKIGNFELKIVSDGTFSLDGGAMFGIVPEPAWSRVYPHDEKNRIKLSLNPLLIKCPGKNILVDLGIGNKFNEKFASIYDIDHTANLFRSLETAGIHPEDISYVIPTHLHLDHAGWATIAQGGEIVPAFPKATYLVQEKELELAHDPNPRVKSSYIRENFLPLEKAKKIKLLKGDEEIIPGVVIRHTGGHTWGHQIVEISGNGQCAVYTGDIIPTAAHHKAAWCMGYDLDPYSVSKQKMHILKKAYENGWILVLVHQLGNPFFKVAQNEKQELVLEQIENL